MTNQEKYFRLCEQQSFPLHAQAWWWKCCTIGKEWDAIIIENAEGQIEAAMPYHIFCRFGIRTMLMPQHSQYLYAYISNNAPKDIYRRLVDNIDNICKKNHVGLLQIQGFFQKQLLEELSKRKFTIRERNTYRIDKIPSLENLPSSFSTNKRRQLRKAVDLQLVDLSVESFYSFERTCWTAQNRQIDYPISWAKAVLSEATKLRQGRLIAAKAKNGALMAALFLAWDDKYAYYLLPAYNPATKNNGGVAWLTTQALKIAKEKGLSFDFEGSMIPSIASSYRQFGGQAVTYYSIEKFYNPLYRIFIWIHQHL